MSIGPVNWGSYPGEQLEAVMAVLLLQERPTSWRRTPSQGDGGVDVGEPHGDGYRIYQVKRFHERLTAKQKTQIRVSLDKVISDPRLDKPVREWVLVLPLDLTSSEERWFRDITGNAPFECNWRGRTFWDSEASKYPYVIDHYFENGKERLLERVRTLSALLKDPQAPPRPADVAEDLRKLHEELNRVDPHYRYDYHLTQEPPEPRRAPGLVMSETRGLQGVGFVTIDVFARFPQALEDRPVGGSFTIVVRDPTSGVDLTDELQAWVQYGRRFDVPVGALTDVHVDAPGGIGGAMPAGGHASIGARVVANPTADRMRLDLVDPQGSVLAGVTVFITSETEGADGRGREYQGIESERAFEFQLRLDRPEVASPRIPAEFGLRQLELAGLPAASVLPAIHFMTQASAPNRLRITLMKGPARVGGGEAPLERDDMEYDELSLVFSQQLADLQPHTPVPVLLPEVVTASDLEEVRMALKLVGGEVVDLGAAKIESIIPPDQMPIMQSAIDAGGPLASIAPLWLELQGQRIPLGTARALLTSPKIESVVEKGDTLVVVITTEGTLEELISPAA